MAKQQRNYRLPERTMQQLAKLVNGGYCNDETAAIVEGVNSLYYHRVEQANEITIASRKAAERPVSPEVIERNGKLWLNLGSGLLAESAAVILAQQFGDDARTEQHAMGDWMIWHREAERDAYALFKCIIMFRL